MNPIEAVIFMEPVGKESDRSAQVHGKDGEPKTIHYTPGPTRATMMDIRRELVKVGAGIDRDMPLLLRLVFYLYRPPGVPKRRQLPTVKPDLKNCLSLVEDAMNRFVYPDDRQNTTILLKKRYIQPGQVPRVEIYLAEDKTP